MPAGKGTYGSKKGRPPKKKVSKGLAALAKKRPKVAAAIMKNKRKKYSHSLRDNYHLIKSLINLIALGSRVNPLLHQGMIG